MNSNCFLTRSCLVWLALTLFIHPRLNHASIVIHDNDFPNDRSVVSISGPGVVLESCPPNADCVSLSFALRRTGPGLDQPLTVFLLYQGTATADVDYRALPGQVTFEAGQEFASASSTPIDDTLYEGDETVIAYVVEGIDYYVDPNQRQATTVVRDNEPPAPPLVSLELVRRDAMETFPYQNAAFWGEFRVLRTGPTTNQLVVFLNTQQGSARLGEDYWLDRVTNGAIRIPPGFNALNVRLYVIDDDLYEGDETVFFHLIAPPPGTNPYEIEFAHSSVAMVIHDNDPVTTRLDITAPRNGEHFRAGEIIRLQSQIIGPGGSNSWSVEFFDGEQLIGTRPAGGAIFWNNAIGGTHVINARAYNPVGVPGQDILVARPVTISVGPGPAWPVVSIGATRDDTLEPCPVCFTFPGIFTITRNGLTNEALTVYLEYDGTARPNQDYRALPHQVTIPPGTNSAHVLVQALDDLLAEGPEIVRATIVTPELATLGYIVSYYASEAMVVINDDESGAPEFRLDIVEPDEGAQFTASTAIEISALGVWTRGEVVHPVEFFAGNVLIGRSIPPQFLRPTIPGLPSVHTFIWTNPPTGQHILTARTELSLNLWATSPPVNITVGDPNTTVLSIGVLDDVGTELPLLAGAFDPARFQISRSGDLSRDLLAFFSVSGSASPGQDYQALLSPVRIPAGQPTATLEVLPVNDTLSEGVETIFVRLEPSPLLGPLPTYEINPTSRDAVAVILDNNLAPGPALEIVSPGEGDHFTLPANIEIIAAAYHPTRDLLRVDFYAGEEKIGDSQLVFDKAFSGGLIVHRFTWSQPKEGSYALTARGFDENQTLVVTSAPVRIAVGPTSNQLPRIVITRPVSGAEFPLDTPIEIVAETRDPDGHVPKVEFLADGRKIGEQTIVFIQPPPPGQTQTFTFVWRDPVPGTHALTARAIDDDGATATSAPVEVKVATSEPLPIVRVSAPDPFAVEPGSNAAPNTATFRIRRHGPTNDALVAAYSLHGTAGNGMDYETLPGRATIPAGVRSVNVIVRPLAENLPEGSETVILRLEPSPAPSAYRVGRRNEAAAVISDGPWVHSLDAAQCCALPGGLLHVCFDAEAGHNFRVEASGDLRTWETLFDTLSQDGAWHFIDTDMENHPRRFYRLRPEPVLPVDE